MKVTPQTQKNNVHEDKKHFKVIFEYCDDLRQDQLILQLYGFIIKKVYLDYEFNTYKVLATNKSDGFNEF